MRRTAVAAVGFVGIVLYARPFTGGFEPDAFVGALGALAGGLVVICIKRLATTEPTRVIMFYYAFWNALFARDPGGAVLGHADAAAACAAHPSSACSASPDRA